MTAVWPGWQRHQKRRVHARAMAVAPAHHVLLGVVHVRKEGVNKSVLFEGGADGESKQSALAVAAGALCCDRSHAGKCASGAALPYPDRPRSLRPEEPTVRRKGEGGRIVGRDSVAGRRLSLDSTDIAACRCAGRWTPTRGRRGTRHAG